MRKRLSAVLAAVLLVSLLVSACTPTEVEVTRVVKETVVETVLETVMVEGTPVVQEVEVVKEVEVEVVVTATPEPVEYEIERVTGMLLQDAGTINPYTYNSGTDDNLILFQFESLHVRDDNGVPQPWLAKEHTVSDDFLTHSLTLEEGVTWADGTPFTAADVAFSFGYYTTYEHTRWTPPLGKFASANVVDDTHVDIVVSEPDADFVINYLVETPMLPKHLWESVTDPPENQENDLDTGRNVGTGPYMLKEYVPEEFYRYEANPNYWAGTPRAKEIVILLYADMSSALAAFQAHEIDMMFVTVPPEQLTLFEAMPGVEVAQGSLYGTTLLVVDNQLPPFDIKEVRQAIFMAVDRKDIVDTVLLGAGTAGSAGWIHPDQAIFDRDVVTEYNPEKANEMLDDLGYVDTDGDGIREFDGQPMSFEFNARAGNAQWMRATELIAEDLMEIGIEAVVTPVEETTFWDKIWPGWDVNNGRNYQISLSGWSPPLQLIPTKVTTMLYSDLSVGRFNLTGTANPAFDELLDEINTTIDEDKRVELLKELQALIAEEAPFASLFHVNGLFPYWSDVIDNPYFVTGDGPLDIFTFLPLSARP